MRIFLSIMALFVSANVFGAVDWKQYKPQGYVNDFAGLLAPEHRQKVESFIKQFHAGAQVQLALITFDSLQGYDSAKVAEFFYEYWNVGRNTRDASALLLLSVKDSTSQLYIGDALLDVLDEEWEAGFNSMMVASLSSGQADKALIGGVRSIVEQVQKNKAMIGMANSSSHKFGEGRGGFGSGRSNNVGGGLPTVAIVATLFGGFLLLSTMLKANSQRHTTLYDYGNGFERNRTGPFGGKKPQHQGRRH